MSIIQGSAMQGASRGFYPFEITNSLFFDSAFLSRTPSSAGNRKTFTFSCWLKKGVGGFETVFRANLTSNNFDAIQFTSDNQIRLFGHPDNTNINCTTDAVLRDPSAWYNVIFAVDTTQLTESNRVKIYVNGTLQSLSTATYPSHNTELNINNTTVHHLSGEGSFDGYMAECNFIDGTALDKDSFGETKENIWIPKDTSGLYASAGANSFRLQFKNSSVGSASSSTVGADTSGKNNHFASSNIATTDNMTDSPTDNHCVMSPITVAESQAQATLSEGNLKVDLGTPGSSVAHTYGTIAIPASGKYFFEGTFSDVSGGPRIGISVVRTSGNQSRYLYMSDGQKIVNTSASSYGASYSASAVIGVAVNVDDNQITFFNSSDSSDTNQGTFTIDLSLSAGGSSSDYFPFITNGSGTSTSVVEFNFGQRTFHGTDGSGTLPSGFVALSTANLPAPAIDPAKGENPTEYFNTVRTTSTGSTLSVDVGFAADWLWTKARNASRAHELHDTVRGNNIRLISDNTTIEQSFSNYVVFDSVGADLGTNHNLGSADGGTATTGIVWAWKAGGAPSADNSAGVGATPTAGSVKIDGANLGSNLAGTIAATRLSASTEAGFSVITYTGNGNNNATVAHGLNAVPEWVFTKARNNGTDNWAVFHSGLTNIEHFIELNLSGGQTSGNTRFGTNAPTSSVMNLGYAGSTNTNLMTYVMYAFAPKEGFSKFGIYDDNVIGSDYENTSPFVYTGFRPAWLMIKGTSNGRDWVMYDNKRTPDDGVYLRANELGTEQTDATNHDISFLSNGFKIRGGSGDINTTGESYIYMAFADQPFKFANGGTE